MSTSKVIITAEAAQALREFEQFRAQATGSLKKVAEVGGQLNGMLATLGVTISVASFAGWVKGAIDAADNLNDLSKTTGIAVSDLAGLKLAAEQTGGDLDSLAASINKLSANVGKDSERFARLGVTAKEPLEAFKQFADVFSAIEDPQMRAALGAEALGNKWQGTAPILSEGSAAIGAMVARGKELNPITQEMADQADMLNDRYAELMGEIDGFKSKLAADMLPALNDVTGAIREAYTESGLLAAVWAGMGALGTFMLTDDFDSYQKKLSDVRAEIASIQESGEHAAYVRAGWGVVGDILWGTKETWDTLLADKKKEMADLIRQATQGAKDAAVAAAAKLAADKAAAVEEQKARDAQRKAEEFLRKKNAEQERAARQYAAQVKGASDYADSLARERVELGLNSEQVAMMAAAREAAKAPTEALRVRIMEEAQALSIARQALEAKTKAEALAADGINSANDEVNAINEQTRALELKTKTYGMLPAQITAMQIAELEASKSAMIWSDQYVADADRKIAALKRLQTAQVANQSVEGTDNVTQARELLDIMSEVDAVTQAAAAGMAASFGKVGSAIGGLTTALSGYGRAQAAVAAQLAASTKAAAGDPAKIAKLTADAARQSAQAQIRSYGDMAGAAKDFFDENSTGYRMLEGVEKAYRAFEMAMAVQTMLAKSGLLTSFTSLFVASKATETAATQASVAPDIAASMAKGAAAAAVGVANQAQGDPYSAWARMAAMAAVMAGLGFAVTGGKSSVSVSKQRQDAAGKGTVFGDADKVSDSISKSIELLADNSRIGLTHTAGMLFALKNIEGSIGGMTNLLLRDGGLTGTANLDHRGSAADFANSGFGKLLLGGPITFFMDKLVGGALSKALGSMANALFGGKISTQDTGLTMDKSSLAYITMGGVNASQYTDIKKDGGVFHSDKYDTLKNALSPEANDQFTKLILSMADGLRSAGAALGKEEVAFNQQLSGFMVDIGKISLKGLNGEQIQKALEATFSKLGDQMAQSVLPGYVEFQKVGEGYLQTVMRVASGMEVAKDELSRLGITAISLSDVLNRQGDIAAEVVRQSIAAAEGTSSVAEIMKMLQGSAAEMADTYRSLRDVRAALIAVGTSGNSLSAELIRSAGGIDQLKSGLSDYFDEFFTESEQTNAKMAALSGEFARMNIAMPESRAAFRSMVQGLDLTTAAGMQQYTTMMSLAGAFAELHPALAATGAAARDAADILAERTSLQDQLDELTMTRIQLLEKERSAIDASNLALFDQVQQAKQAVTARESLASAYEREQAAIVATQDRMASFAGTLRNLHDSALLGTLSPLTPQQKYAEAKSQYERVLAAARSGDANAQSKYSEAYNAFLNASRTVNASGSAYQMDFAYAQNATAEAASWAEAQVDVAKASLQALQAQVSGLITINDSVLSVGDAIQALAAAMGPAGAGLVGNSQTAVLQSLYQSLLGRSADQEGMQYWVGQMGKGVAIGDIARAFSESAEYGQRNVLPVQSTAASLNYASMGTSAMAPLVSEIKALREDNRALRTEVAGLRTDQQRQVSAQITAAFAAANSSADKIAAATMDAARETLQATESKVAPV